MSVLRVQSRPLAIVQVNSRLNCLRTHWQKQWHAVQVVLASDTRRVRIEWLAGDAGYDSESNHRLCRDEHGIRSLIPPGQGQPTTKPATGRYRRLMQTRFDKARYGQRWQVETVVSMIKRRLGSATTGRTYWSR